MAQAAISQTLVNLEAEIGVKLVDRSGRSAQLTPEGEVFYRESLRTLEQAEYAVEAAQRAARGEVGTIAVGVCGAAASAFFRSWSGNIRPSTRASGSCCRICRGQTRRGVRRRKARRRVHAPAFGRHGGRLPFTAALPRTATRAIPACRGVKTARIKVEGSR